MIDYGVKINVGGNADRVLQRLVALSEKMTQTMRRAETSISRSGTQISNSMQKAGAAIQRTGEQARKVFKDATQAARDARQEFQKIGPIFSGINSKLAALGLSVGAVDIGRRIINAGASEEDALARLRFAFNDDQKARAMLSKLQQIGRTYPVARADIFRQAGFLAPIFKDETDKYLKMFANVVAGSGGDFGNIAFNFSQIKQAGRPELEDIKQFAYNNIPIFEEIGKVLGKSVAEVRQLQTEGKITFDIIAKAFENMTKEGGIYFGALEARAHTFRGQWQIIGNKMQEIWVKFFEKARPYLQQFSDWVEKQIENFDELIPKIKAVGYTLAGVFAFKTLTGFIAGLNQIIKLLTVMRGLSVFGAGIGGILGGLGLAGMAVAGVVSLYNTAKSQSDHNFIRKYTDYDFTSHVKDDPEYINKQLKDETFGRDYLSVTLDKLAEYNKKITGDLPKFKEGEKHWNLLNKTMEANTALMQDIKRTLGIGMNADGFDNNPSNAITKIADVNTDLSPRGVSGNGGIKNFQITFNSPVVQVDDNHVEGEKYTPEQLGQTAAKEFVNILTQIAVQ